MQVKARAAGKCKVTVFLKAATCVFAGGSKEITVEFEAADASEKRELDFQLIMMGTRHITYSLNLNAKVENAQGDKNDDFLLVKLDCRNPMKEEEQTVTFEEAPLTEVTTPIPEEAVEEEDTDVEVVVEEDIETIVDDIEGDSDEEIVDEEATDEEPTEEEGDDENP
jgi:hypothetical protein